MSSFNPNFRQQKTTTSNNQNTVVSNTPIQNRFYLKELLKIYPQYNIYQGVDSNAMKLVTIYLKPTNAEFNFSKKIKEELRLKVSPSVKWSGIYKIDKNTFNVQIHQKYGPSLKTMFAYIREPIQHKDFLLLMYQLIRLVEKFATIGYVYRQLDMQHIIFDCKPEKNDLFLLNVFPIRKKGEQSPPLNSRFCSRAAHLGLRASHKDDLESICYILLTIYTRGSFLKKVNPQLLQQSKAHIDLNSFKGQLPQIFKNFYNYTINLNYDDEINFFHWRSELYNLIGKQALANPYGWMMAKGSQQNLQTVTQLDGQPSCQMIYTDNELGDQLEDELKPQDMNALLQLTNKFLLIAKR